MKARNYKKEYNKYGKSKAAKKYRAELNQYNRKSGTYGNGDGMDAAHESGKIKRFVKAAINRANNRPKKRGSK
jgi:predicted mannosyl-3-phosphoglycerate phosphatase (HAD superfamily)